MWTHAVGQSETETAPLPDWIFAPRFARETLTAPKELRNSTAP